MTVEAVAKLIGINLVLAVALSMGLKGIADPTTKTIAFLICVLAIFALNTRIGIHRRLLWSLNALNLLAAVFLGTLTVFTALPALPLLIRALFGV